MANFNAADVKKLREQTGAGMMDCKKALEESEGDLDKALEFLRVKGLKGVQKREGRTATNGLVVAKLDGNASGVLVELNCETDFVAKGERFGQLAQDVVDFVATSDLTETSELLGAEIKPGVTVREFLDEANASLGEKIELRRFARFTEGYVSVYLHKTSPDLPPQLGVLVSLDKENEQLAREIAQHIAAAAPEYLTRDAVAEETVANERRIAEATAREEGKPEAALPKIVEGRVNGFFKDKVLVEQPYVRESKKTVKAILDEAGVTVTRFVRFRVGA
jgi:elongation factor Ts